MKNTLKSNNNHTPKHALRKLFALMFFFFFPFALFFPAETELEKPTIQAFAHRIGGQVVEGDIRYEADFEVPLNFGEVGAIFVENEHHKEMFLQDIVLDGLPHGAVNITCGSWVHSKYDNDRKRIFFTNKVSINLFLLIFATEDTTFIVIVNADLFLHFKYFF
jgi:hypothetical protein